MPAHQPDGSPELSGAIDLAAALQTVDGDRDLLLELGQVFVEDCPQRLRALREGVREGSAPAIERAAHTLKGALSSLGAVAACRQAADLETIGRESQLADASAALAALERHLDRVIAILRDPAWVDRT